MPGTFAERMDELAEQVGAGILRGQVEIDQVYAYNIHEGHWLNYYNPGLRHHTGFKTLEQHSGEGHFLTTPLLGEAPAMLQHLADHALDGELDTAMAENMEGLSASASALTPVEFGDLADSGHPTVHDDGALVYDRPPRVGRLTDAEIDAKNRTRGWARNYLGEHHPAAGTVHERRGGPEAVNPLPTVDQTGKVPAA